MTRILVLGGDDDNKPLFKKTEGIKKSVTKDSVIN